MIDKEPSPENKSQSAGPSTSFNLNLQTAVNMGEYEPNYLSQFEEWQALTPNMQYEFVRKGIENKRRQLRVQYAVTFNSPHYSKKPELAEASKNIHERLKQLQRDEERLIVHYSSLI